MEVFEERFAKRREPAYKLGGVFVWHHFCPDIPGPEQGLHPEQILPVQGQGFAQAGQV